VIVEGAFGGIFAEVVHDDVVVVEAHEVEHVLVGSAHEQVVGVDELYEGALCHAQAGVARRGHSGVALPQVDEVVLHVAELGQRALVRAGVDDDDLAL